MSAAYPDGTTEAFKYDLNGNRREHVNEAGTTTYVYEATGERLERLERDGATVAEYFYL